jgi:protein-L-isoaspartate(D-aspartate) O-methyltransferase
VERARENLDAAGCHDVVVATGDGAMGYPDRAPYDRIIAAVGVWDLAPAWLAQLTPNGRLVVPLDLRGVQRSVAFERDGDHWTSKSAMPCGFMRMRGPFAGPERTYQVSPALSLGLPQSREVDPDAVAAVLAEAPVVNGTGTEPSPEEVFDGLSLWLAVREPRCCAVSEKVAGDAPPVLRDPPLRAPDSTVTIGILGDDGVALLSKPGDELTVLCYGNSAVADDLVGHVREWTAAGRPNTADLRIDAYPDGVPCPGGDVLLEKGTCRLILSW